MKIGVRQGCVASPLLYNTFSERIIQSIENLEGVSVGGMNTNELRYADDTAVIARETSAANNNSEGSIWYLSNGDQYQEK